jgi:hypothetical protein
MRSLFAKHRVRNTFYYLIAGLYVFTMWVWYLGIITDMTSTLLGAFLFFVDLFAHLYDPDPDRPGPWFRAHFHRVFDEEEDEDG